MVEYSEQEEMLVKRCVNFYKREVLPDEPIDKNDPKIVLAAVDFCHSAGRFIRSIKQHNLMYSILEKNGQEVESNEKRQARLKKERLQKIHDMRIDKFASIETEKRRALKEAVDNRKKLEEELKNAENKEQMISKKEVRAKAAQDKAEQIVKDQADEIARLKEELEKKQDKNYLAEAVAELEKGNEAVITKEAPETIELSTEVPIETPPPTVQKEKTVEELIEDLK